MADDQVAERLQQWRQRRRAKRLLRLFNQTAEEAAVILMSLEHGPSRQELEAELTRQVTARIAPIFGVVLWQLFLELILPVLIRWLLDQWFRSREVGELDHSLARIEFVSGLLLTAAQRGPLAYDRQVDLLSESLGDANLQLCHALALPLRRFWHELQASTD